MPRLAEEKRPKTAAFARYADERETDEMSSVSAIVWFGFAIAAVLILACLRAS
jgi:hypothetical protein